MKEGEARERGEGAHRDDPPFGTQGFEQLRGFEVAILEQLGIFGGDDDAEPREERDDVDREGDEEGIAPAPREEILRREIASLVELAWEREKSPELFESLAERKTNPYEVAERILGKILTEPGE